MNTPNICMLSFATPDISSYAEKIFKNNRLYAEKYGYDWEEHWEVLDESRPPAWNKILYILKALEKGYDWIFWIDADAVVMNDSISLTNFIDDRYDFILCKDAFCWNTGAWFIKNSTEAKEMLEYTYAKEEFTDSSSFAWEQGAFINSCFEKGSRIKVLKQRDFNSVAKETRQFFPEGHTFEVGVFKFVLNLEAFDNGVYEEGDFLIHFALINHEGRDTLLKIYKPDLY